MTISFPRLEIDSDVDPTESYEGIPGIAQLTFSLAFSVQKRLRLRILHIVTMIPKGK